MSERMRAVRRRGTKPELALQRELRALGLRFITDAAPIKEAARRADVLFRSARIVVLVDGCFWHSCPMHGTQPKANAAWWRAKLKANRRRDVDTDRMLRAAGWSVVRIWAHEDMTRAARRIRALLTRKPEAGRRARPRDDDARPRSRR